MWLAVEVVVVGVAACLMARWLLPKTPIYGWLRAHDHDAVRLFLRAVLWLDALLGAWIIVVAFSPSWLVDGGAVGLDYDALPLDVGICALGIAVFLIGLSQFFLFGLGQRLRRLLLRSVLGTGAAVGIVFLGAYAAIVGNDPNSLNASAGNLIIVAVALSNVFSTALYLAICENDFLGEGAKEMGTSESQ